jgi:hypothetical protein
MLSYRILNQYNTLSLVHVPYLMTILGIFHKSAYTGEVSRVTDSFIFNSNDNVSHL